MSEESKKARAAMKAKAHRMADGDPHAKVDASDWSPAEEMWPGKKKGPRPLNPREYKRGGKVVEHEHIEGRAREEHHVTKMGRHPTHGCRVGNAEHANYLGGTRPTGGRIAKQDGGAVERKHGGKTKGGKTNINIIIGSSHREPPAAPPMGQAPVRPAGMVAPPPGMPPPGMGPGVGGPPPMPPPGMMPRKSGGRAYRSYKDMDAGAGTGDGRLEKTEIAKHS